MENVLNKIKSRTVLSAFIGCCLLALSVPSQALQNTAKPFTEAKRFNSAGQITGVILPDPDGAGPLRHPATRNTYNPQGLLSKTESGELSGWQHEGIDPQSWAGFTVLSQVGFTYNARGLKIAQAKQDQYGNTETYQQYNYDEYDRVNCSVTRMNPNMFDNSTANACVPTYSSTYGYDRVTNTITTI